MNITIIGGTGFIGKALVSEALQKGYSVTSISKNGSSLKLDNLTNLKLDIFDKDKLTHVLAKADVVISAYNPSNFHIKQDSRYVEGYQIITDVVKDLKKRIVIVIGATSLLEEDGELVSNGFYPAQWIKALAGSDKVYSIYKDDKDLKATFVSPSAHVFNGTRTTNFAYSENIIIKDNHQNSTISIQDLAYAVVKEAADPHYLNKRFTVGYK